MGRHGDNYTAARSYYPNQFAHRRRIICYMLEHIRGHSYVECSSAEWELDSVGTAIRRPPSVLRNPDRKPVGLYTHD
jgi:hypothetical protein